MSATYVSHEQLKAEWLWFGPHTGLLLDADSALCLPLLIKAAGRPRVLASGAKLNLFAPD